MERHFGFHILFLAVFFAGCAKTDRLVVSEDSDFPFPLSLTARYEDESDSKTQLSDDGVSVWWSPSDAIQSFFGNYAIGRYFIGNETPSKTGVFYCDNNSTRYGPGYYDSQILFTDRRIFFYPYNSSNDGSGDEVIFTLPDVQQGVSGTFNNDLLPAMAQDGVNGNLVFYHVCGGIRFSVTQEGITSVIFKSNSSEPISGRVEASFDENGIPVIDSVLEGVDSVKVCAPGYFKPGEFYFAVMLPQTLANGISCKLVKGSKSAVRSTSNSIRVNRAHFGVLDNLDEGLSFQDDPTLPNIPEGNIIFADSGIKACLVAAFDGDGDGEISYAEAAAVYSLDGVFGQEKTFTSFDEFTYFTSIKQTPTGMCEGWTKLSSIRLPASLQCISPKSFQECSLLTSIEFPDGLKVIGRSAFNHCEGLKAVHIPSSVESIERNAFGNTSITSVELGKCLEEGIPKPSSSSDIYGYIVSRFGSSPGIENVVVLDGVEKIPDYTFYRCSSLKSVSLPSSVTEINKYAFQWCSSLESFVLPDHLTTLGSYAFSHCNISAIEIPASVKEIGPYAFDSCRNLEDVHLFDGLQKIGYYAFYGSKSLVSVEFPTTLESLGVWAFCGSGIESVTIKRPITDWGRSSFRDCFNLTSVSLPEGIVSIPHETFQNCRSLPDINIPESVTSIGAYVFAGCSALKYIRLPSGLTNLGLYSFQDCVGLEYAVFNSYTPPEGASWHYGNLYGNDRFEGTTCPIYVPDDSVELYKTDQYMSKYSDRIHPLSEL